MAGFGDVNTTVAVLRVVLPCLSLCIGAPTVSQRTLSTTRPPPPSPSPPPATPPPSLSTAGAPVQSYLALRARPREWLTSAAVGLHLLFFATAALSMVELLVPAGSMWG